MLAHDMRASVVRGAFGLERVALEDIERPRPGPAEVLLRVRAASLNYRDLLVAKGEYNPRYPLPLILGSDAVCEVVELGPENEGTGLALGERVCPLVAQGWLDGAPDRDVNRFTLGGPRAGVFAEYVVARSDSVLGVPPYLDDFEAACLPCAAVTAWSALRTLSPLASDASVLTLGSGGVSVFALQIARLSGARVIATSRDAQKRARLLALGADAVLETDAAGWGRRARSLAGEQGVDHVVEVGGAETLKESLQAVRAGGTVSLIGVLGGKEIALDLLPLVMRNVRLQGVLVGHRRSFAALLAAFASASVHPVIDSIYPLARIHEAFARLASGQHFGKICLQIAD
jgi:NADPH:quinone reductase-like Zn-dependent oxidoreductase